MGVGEARVRLPSCQDLQTEANINRLLYPLLADNEPSSSSGLITSPSNAYQQTPSILGNASSTAASYSATMLTNLIINLYFHENISQPNTV